MFLILIKIMIYTIAILSIVCYTTVLNNFYFEVRLFSLRVHTSKIKRYLYKFYYIFIYFMQCCGVYVLWSIIIIYSGLKIPLFMHCFSLSILNLIGICINKYSFRHAYSRHIKRHIKYIIKKSNKVFDDVYKQIDDIEIEEDKLRLKHHTKLLQLDMITAEMTKDEIIELYDNYTEVVEDKILDYTKMKQLLLYTDSRHYYDEMLRGLINELQ